MIISVSSPQKSSYANVYWLIATRDGVWIHRITPWCCMSMRRAKFRPCSAPSQCCRWAWDTSKGLRTIISVTAPRPCLPRSTPEALHVDRYRGFNTGQSRTPV